MEIGQMMWNVKNGNKVARAGWNGKGMHVEIMHVTDIAIESFLVIKNVKGTYNTWVPSISDLFADDWEVVQ